MKSWPFTLKNTKFAERTEKRTNIAKKWHPF